MLVVGVLRSFTWGVAVLDIWRWWNRWWFGGYVFFIVLDSYILLVDWVSHDWCCSWCGRLTLKTWVSEYIARVGGSLFCMMFDACFDGLSIILRVRFQLSVGTVFKKCVQISGEVRALMCWVDLSSERIEIRDFGFYLCQFCIVLVSRECGFVSTFLV